MNKSNKNLKHLMQYNSVIVAEGYNPDFSYEPAELLMSLMPVKYGMSDKDREECKSHNPDFARVSATEGWNVRFVIEDDGMTYFAGPDGFVWYLVNEGQEANKSDSHEIDWDVAYSVAAFDLHFNGENVPFEAINYGWYLARCLSDMIWSDNTDKSDNTGNTDK